MKYDWIELTTYRVQSDDMFAIAQCKDRMFPEKRRGFRLAAGKLVQPLK